MTTWIDLATAPAEELARVGELAAFDLVEFRAKQGVATDYDQGQLQAKEREIEVRQAAEREAFRLESLRDPGAVMNIQPLPFEALGTRPWLDDLDTVQAVTTDCEIPMEHLAKLDQEAIRTGRLIIIDPTDRRKRWLYVGIEYRDKLPPLPEAPPATTPKPSRSTTGPRLSDSELVRFLDKYLASVGTPLPSQKRIMTDINEQVAPSHVTRDRIVAELSRRGLVNRPGPRPVES